MASVRTQYREEYAPRTTSKAALRALVETLADFKPGLPTTSRKIRARAIGAGKTTDLEGPESWKVTDPHSLADLQQVRVELLLTRSEHRRCEIHVEFRSGHTLLSVSDLETGWGKGVFEDMRSLLGALSISSKGFNEVLRKAYGLLDIFQNVLLAFAVAAFAVWLSGRGASYLYASLALFIAGVMPAMTHSFHFFSPPRKPLIFQEAAAKGRNFPWAEATAVLAFMTGMLELAKALIALLWY
jgi:hypothetical protein